MARRQAARQFNRFISFTSLGAGCTLPRVENLLRSIVVPHRHEPRHRMTHAAPTAAPTLVSLDDFRTAAATLRGVAVRTPLHRSDALEARFGVPVFLKPEMLQRGGAFKFRGAYWFVSQLSAERRAKGLVAPSSGNHGQAVALAAQAVRRSAATVVMPTTATRAKREGAERLGARVILEGTTTAERMAKARGDLRARGRDARAAVRRSDDHRRPGHDRPRDRRGPAGRGARARAGRRRRTERGRRGGGQARGAGGARDRRGAGGIAEAHARARGGSAGDHSRRIRAASPTACSRCGSARSTTRTITRFSTTSSRSATTRSPARDALPARPAQARGRAERRDHGRRAARGRGEAGPRTVCILSGGNIEWDGLLGTARDDAHDARAHPRCGRRSERPRVAQRRAARFRVRRVVGDRARHAVHRAAARCCPTCCCST